MCFPWSLGIICLAMLYVLSQWMIEMLIVTLTTFSLVIVSLLTYFGTIFKICKVVYQCIDSNTFEQKRKDTVGEMNVHLIVCLLTECFQRMCAVFSNWKQSAVQCYVRHAATHTYTYTQLLSLSLSACIC